MATLVLFCLLHLSSSLATYYIRPTAETPCFHEDCSTLLEIANNTDRYIVGNTTMVFLPGVHILNSTIIVLQDLQSLTLTGNSSSSTKYTTEISCKGASALIFRNVSTVVIKVLLFTSCGNVSIPKLYKPTLDYSGHTLPTIIAMHVLNFQLLNSKLINGHQSVYSYESNVVSNSNLFVNNRAKNGAAIRMINSNFTFIGSNEFMGNSATGQGGAIHSTHSDVLFKGSVSLISNSASFEGGGIYAQHSKLSFGSYLNASKDRVTEKQKHILANSALREFSNLDNNVERGVFIFTGNSADVGGSLYLTHGMAVLSGLTVFENNSVYETPIGSGGGAVALNESSWFSSAFVGFASNSAPNGGALYVLSSHWNSQGRSVFLNNTAKLNVYVYLVSLGNGGAAYGSKSLLEFHNDTGFFNNSAEHKGGGIYILSSNLTDVTTSKILFSGNKAEGLFGSILPIAWIGKDKVGIGGGMYSDLSFISWLGNVSFTINSAYDFGGALFLYNSILNLSGNSTFQANRVKSFGGGIRAVIASLTVCGKSLFVNNSADNGGAISVAHGQLHILGQHLSLADNTATSSGGGIHIVHSYFSLVGNSSHFYNNSAGIYGGAMAAMAIAGHASGEATFSRNFALFGAAVALLEGNFTLNSSSITFTQNSASLGGAMYLDRSNISMTGNKTQFVRNLATQPEFGGYGGAIYSSESAIYFIGVIVFKENSATSGGALVIAKHDWKMLLYFLLNSRTYFIANHANMHGGAIMVEDAPLSYCGAYVNAPADLGRACFFRIGQNGCRVSLAYQLSYSGLLDNVIGDDYIRKFGTYMSFANNTADYGGSVLYGGAIENCRVCYVEFSNEVFLETGVETLAALTNQTAGQVSINKSDFSSDALEVCICENVMVKCNSRSIDHSIHPGETVSIPVVTVGQLQGRVPAIVNARFASSQTATLDHLQNAQQTNMSCTHLRYTMFSRLASQSALLTLFAEGPCGELGKKLQIVTNFLPCPAGFVLSQSQGACICEERLHKYTNSCDIDSRTITRSSYFWVGYDHQSRGLILHPHCPFDYCTLETFSFTLNSTDQQCAYGRSGTLCGACKSGLSVNLGSSRCSSCSNTFVLLLLPFAAAGFFLVTFLFICKLTVSAGTTSGLIFYANIMAVNQSVLFPPGETNILTVFIAWLNLDLGIETCFFDGMDAYTRTWLQFVFPLYIWSLVGLVSLTSHYSMTIARIISPTNPVAVLATLFLLSYTKLLRTIIATFSFTTLDYPDDHKVPVWAYDGNIRFCEGKHAVLFVTGLMAFLFAFLPYTLLLLCGQFIIAGSNYRVLSWANRRTCKPFLDAYYAPYKNGYRYWTGLLLVLRLILFTVSAVVDINTPKDPSINLLVLVVACIGLSVLSWNTGSMYKKWYCNALESSFILNLAILAAASYQVKVETGSQRGVIYTSVGVAFVTFLVIIAYHVIERVRDTRVWKYSIKPALINFEKRVQQLEENENSIQMTTQPVSAPRPKVTTTFIELRETLLESQH